MLHIIYRTYGGENKKERPPYYSKIVSLLSLIHAAEQLGATNVEIIYIVDGDMPADRLHEMQRSGEVLAYPALGMHGSIRTMLELPTKRGWPSEDLIWFAEDDYLYKPQAFTNLIAATKAFPEADYFGLYALIGAHKPDGGLAEDYLRIPQRWTGSQPRMVNGHSWYRALSTTLTFGTRVSAHASDRALFEYVSKFGGAYDHAAALIYQGFVPYSFRFLSTSFLNQKSPSGWFRRAAILGRRVWLNAYSLFRKRGGARAKILVAPDPALITHLETAYLAAGTEWGLVAQQTNDRMTALT